MRHWRLACLSAAHTAGRGDCGVVDEAVAAIIPGPRYAAEFNANLELLRHPIPPALWADLRCTDRARTALSL